MSWIAYVGPIKFPWGQAASRRVHGNALSLAASGYRVVVASGSETPSAITPLDSPGAVGHLSHIGLDICPRQNESEVRKALRIVSTSCRRVLRWLEAQPTRPSHVILYGGYASYLLHLLPWCHRNSVALLADVVEWYDGRHLRGGRFGLSNVNSNIAMRFLFQRCDGIIAISAYLAEYFRRKGCRVVRVPPTLDVSAVVPRLEPGKSGEPMTLIYAGDAGKKDLLPSIVGGVERADGGAGRVRLIVFGPSERDVASSLPGDTLPRTVTCMGRVPQETMPGHIRMSDYSVFLRRSERYANAGFPTKFVESLAHGTPVMCNLTSDLAMYLRDMNEGTVCADQTSGALAAAIERAMSLSRDERHRMRTAARKRAEECFDYRGYGDDLARLVEVTRR